MIRIISLVIACGATATLAAQPAPSGKLVDLGGHRLHVNCTGRGAPTVVVEDGLGDFSVDWTLVQSRVSAFTRICTYDRGGYAWSDPGPKPRTFSQLNVELHDALAKLGERGPFVLVGHSFGGPVVRNFASIYPADVAGMVLVDAAHEGLRVGIGGGKTIRLGDGAKGTDIPPPHEESSAADQPTVRAEDLPAEFKTLDSMYKVLPPDSQTIHLWAQQLPGVYDAENSETQWSEEVFAKWLATPQAGVLGAIPVIVLSQADAGYKDGDFDFPAAQLEKERREGQAKLVLLSSNGKQVIVHSGHNMNLEAPADVSNAIREVVNAVRHHRRLRLNSRT
ncbi:MAG TPA: alpha/beta hydrolase [Bryobacteraceae bacterium]|nr:alpha/beta hydrolase [Bryobacteraceae bacterium]